MSLRARWQTYRQHRAEKKHIRAETRRRMRMAVLRARIEVFQTIYVDAASLPYSIYEEYRRAREELAVLEYERDSTP